jgi:antirestriction protein ArdC
MTKLSKADRGFNKKSSCHNLNKSEPKMNIYDTITARITEKLSAGEIPWKRSWDARTQAPRNLVSKKRYQGINIFLVGSLRYQSPWFLTYKQAQDLGGSVKKGEKGCPIVFWSFSEKEDDNGKKSMVPFLRQYSVFNVSQVDGLDLPEDLASMPVVDLDGAEEFDLAEQIATNMPNRPEIKHGFSRACYSPSQDIIMMPERSTFTGGSEYFSVLFHEMGHSVDHESRLNRKNTGDISHYGDAIYSKNELVAEFTSAFLCAEAGISQSVITNQAAYIQGWLKALKNDNKLLISAAALAQKAANFIMNRTEPETVTA